MAKFTIMILILIIERFNFVEYKVFLALGQSQKTKYYFCIKFLLIWMKDYPLSSDYWISWMRCVRVARGTAPRPSRACATLPSKRPMPLSVSIIATTLNLSGLFFAKLAYPLPLCPNPKITNVFVFIFFLKTSFLYNTLIISFCKDFFQHFSSTIRFAIFALAVFNTAGSVIQAQGSGTFPLLPKSVSI